MHTDDCNKVKDVDNNEYGNDNDNDVNNNDDGGNSYQGRMINILMSIL